MSVWPPNSPSELSCDKAGATPAVMRDEMRIKLRRLVFIFQIYFDSGGTETTLMYRSANFKNVGQFGASVCPPLCCRNAISPSIKAVSVVGKFVVPRSFLPS